MKEAADFPVAVVGAGELLALQEFLTTAPADGGIAYIIVASSLSADDRAWLLQSSTLPIQQVEDTVVLEPNRVYLLPPARPIASFTPAYAITVAATTQPAPIDACCKLLAAALGVFALGVVLGGDSTDGALGLTHIREVGGVAAVQEPRTTLATFMPSYALAMTAADLVLPAVALAPRLVAYGQQLAASVQWEATEPLPPAILEPLQQIQVYVFRHINHDLTIFDPLFLLRKVEKRRMLLALPSLADYARACGEQAQEARLLRQEVLCSARQFMRGRQSLDVLVENAFVPILQAKSDADQVRIWVAGCATGEEAYTICILLLETAARLGKQPEIRLFATDINEGAIQQAREGLFPSTIVADLGEERLQHFFVKEGNSYRANQLLRQQVIFAAHNLLHAPPFLKLDLIVCRHLLPALKPQHQQQLADLFYHSLQPQGYLLMDASAALQTDFYRRVEPGQMLYQRQLGSGSSIAPPLPATVVHPAPVQKPNSQYEALYNQFLQRHTPPGLLVDADLNIVYYAHGVSAYLHQPAGVATEQVLHRVRPELREALAAALLQTNQTGEPTCSPPITLIQAGAPHCTQICVELASVSGKQRYLTVFFRKAEPSPNPASLSAEDPAAHLQSAITDAYARLRMAGDEYATMSEEMRVANEELLSLNEDLMSRAAELERNKYELQIANRELHTINRENQHNLEKLQLLSANLQNLMAAVNIPTLFLDHALRIRWFSPSLHSLFNVLPGDEGRPLEHMTHHLHYTEFTQDAAAVMAAAAAHEREIESDNGGWYLMRILPYRTAKQLIDGVVITFFDITERKRADEALRQLNASLEQRVEDRTLELARSNRELDQFAYIASHDLKAPLRAVTNLAEWVQKDNAGALPPASQEHLTKLRARIARMEQLLEDLLTYSRVGRQHHTPELVDLDALIRGLRHVLLVPSGFRIETGSSLHTLMTERVPLEIVLRNLIGNAIKHHDHPQAGVVEIAAEERDDWVEFTVKDNGPGIAAHQQERIFQVFQSLRPRDEVEGSGMGLAIAKKTIESRGGMIQVISEPGQGAVFRFTWPKTTSQ